MQETIKEGFMAFIADGGSAVGAVREVAPHGRPELVMYVENAGDFVVPFNAVSGVHSHKVMLIAAKLDPRLLSAIGHAHDAEDPEP